MSEETKIVYDDTSVIVARGRPRVSVVTKLAEMREAQAKFATFTQEQVDKIFYAAALAANAQRIPLAQMAVEETGDGRAGGQGDQEPLRLGVHLQRLQGHQDLRRHRGEQGRWHQARCRADWHHRRRHPHHQPHLDGDLQVPAGAEDPQRHRHQPTSARQEVHAEAALHRARRSRRRRRARGHHRLDRGARRSELTNTLMGESDIPILATGGAGMVKAAYSSGTPAIGVGAGNTPCVIDETADLRMAVNSIIHSKTFDNGMICASEQSVTVVGDKAYAEAKAEFERRGCYFLKGDELDKVRKTIIINGRLNAKIVGQRADTIAGLAAFEVPDTKILIGEVESVDICEAFAHEKPEPVLGHVPRG